MSEVYETIKRGLEDAVNGRVTEHMVEYAPVVRCKDCRYGITAHGISNGWVLCSKPYTERGNAMHRIDWFCADGVRKE